MPRLFILAQITLHGCAGALSRMSEGRFCRDAAQRFCFSMAILLINLWSEAL